MLIILILKILSRNKISVLVFLCLLITIYNFFKLDNLKAVVLKTTNSHNSNPCLNNSLFILNRNLNKRNLTSFDKTLLLNSSTRIKFSLKLKYETSSLSYSSTSRHLDHKNQISSEANKEILNNHDYSLTSKFIKFPHVFDLIPHLINKTEFRPRVELTKNRQNVKYVIGIPTVKRAVNYLNEMINSLLRSFQSEEEKNQVLIVIQISELNDTNFINQTIYFLNQMYFKEIENGLIDIIVPPKDFYPKKNFVDKIKDYVFNDNTKRIAWRVKQNFDITFLMSYSYLRGQYYLQLEDDVVTSNGFIEKINNYISQINETETKWRMIEFSELGFIGKLFRCSDLPIFMHMFLIYSFNRPVDLIHEVVFQTLACDPGKDPKNCKKNMDKIRLRYYPSLFQHIGMRSSLEGKIQKLKDSKFNEQSVMIKHPNPVALINSSLKPYLKYTIQDVYTGNNYFWTEKSNQNDFILFRFNRPFLLKKYIIRSANSFHPFDFMPANTSLEIKPIASEIKNLTQNEYYQINKTSNFYVIDRLNETNHDFVGDVDYNLFGLIKEVRLLFPKYESAWILINEIGFY